MNTTQHIVFTNEITRSFSKERLAGYKRRCDSDDGIELLSRYIWNIALSESLYPVLQTLEIALRNRIYEVVSEHYKNDSWLDDTELLYPKEQEKINDAKNEIRKAGKMFSFNHIIAELSFGFWTSLFDSRYEHQQRLWPILIKPIFPYIPARIRTRAFISKLLNRIRNLRNRIYHYEPVWYWQDLTTQHKDIIETLGWIDPHLKTFNLILDRFNSIYNNGHETFKKLILEEIK